MSHFSLSSLRLRLILLVLLAIVPPLGLTFYTAVEQRRWAAANVQADALRLSRLASAQQEQLVEGGRQLLATLAQLPEVRRQDSQACSTLLAGLLRQHPLYANFGVIKLNGDLFCSALPTSGSINLADRTYFQNALKSRAFAIGEYQIGRVTKKATINFGYPVLNSKGVAEGVVFAALDLAWLNQLATKVQLPSGSTLTVIDRNGTILAHHPDPEKWVGRSMPELPIIKTLLTQHEGVAEEIDVDGVPRLLAFTPLSGAQEAGYVYLSIAIPEEVAFAEVNRTLARNLTALGAIAVLALLAAWAGSDLFVLRQVNALVTAAKRLSAGDLNARSGLPHGGGELSELAQTFDGMAESLQKRQVELLRSKEEIQRNLERIRALREIDIAITSTLDLRIVLDFLLEKMDLFSPYPAATTVRLRNKESGLLEPVACRNLNEERWRVETWQSGHGLAKTVIETRAPLIVGNVQTDPRVQDPGFFHRYSLVSYLGIPLMAKREILGVLGFYTREEHQFTAEEVEFLSALASQAAIAIHNAQLYAQTKRQAIELEKSSKMKSEFLSVMSHELRTPLTAVMGYTGMIQDRMLGKINQQQEEALRKISVQSGELLTMINSILDTTKIEAGAVVVEREQVNLGSLFDEVRSAYGLPLNKELTLIWDYPSDLPVLRTDRGKVKQILHNLIHNAIKFTAKGEVRVSARTKTRSGTPKEVELTVADTGIGISAEAIPTIFEMFRQVDSSETRIYGGVGLGLYIIKKYSELLGGIVEVQSEPGKGSMFTVTLPVE